MVAMKSLSHRRVGALLATGVVVVTGISLM
jgi:hypothetical protein